MNTRSVVDRITLHARGAAKRLDHIRCSFCGRDADQVEKMVSGPGVYICDQCVRLATEIMAGS